MKLQLPKKRDKVEEPSSIPQNGTTAGKGKKSSGKKVNQELKKIESLEKIVRPNPAEFAAMVAREIVKNLTTLRARPLARDLHIEEIKDIPAPEGENLMLVDTSVLIDARILPV